MGKTAYFWCYHRHRACRDPLASQFAPDTRSPARRSGRPAAQLNQGPGPPFHSPHSWEHGATLRVKTRGRRVAVLILNHVKMRSLGPCSRDLPSQAGQGPTGPHWYAGDYERLRAGAPNPIRSPPVPSHPGAFEPGRASIYRRGMAPASRRRRSARSLTSLGARPHLAS